MTAFFPGVRFLLRDQPLLPAVIVDHVRTHFAGEPEPNGPVFCYRNTSPLRLLRYDQCELVPQPDDYEPPPVDAGERRLVLDWLLRNQPQLIALHGADAVARTKRHVRDQIKSHERIAAALAVEPQASAMRRAEIAIDASGETP